MLVEGKTSSGLERSDRPSGFVRAKPTCGLSPLQQEHGNLGRRQDVERFGAQRQKY